MKAELTKETDKLYYIDNNRRKQEGINPGMSGTIDRDSKVNITTLIKA